MAIPAVDAKQTTHHSVDRDGVFYTRRNRRGTAIEPAEFGEARNRSAARLGNDQRAQLRKCTKFRVPDPSLARRLSLTLK